MRRSDQFIIFSIGVAIIINIASNFLGNKFPTAGLYVSVLLGIGVLAWTLFRLIGLVWRYERFGRLATSVIFLSSKNEILLIMHPYHHRLLQPGKRLKQWELPHQAVARTLDEEAGIKDFEFHPSFHETTLAVNDTVEQVPSPYHVQIEHRRQKGFRRFHYDLFYVCRFKDHDREIASDKYLKPRWVTLAELEQMDRKTRPFEDVHQLYKKVLKHVQSLKENGS